MRLILILRKMLPRPRTPLPDLLAPIKEHPRNRTHHDTQKRQQRTRPLQAQVLVHLFGEEREPCADEVAHEDDARQRARAVRLVRVDDVVEDGEDDDVDARAEEGARDDGDDPVDGGEGCPCEPRDLH